MYDYYYYYYEATDPTVLQVAVVPQAAVPQSAMVQQAVQCSQGDQGGQPQAMSHVPQGQMMVPLQVAMQVGGQPTQGAVAFQQVGGQGGQMVPMMFPPQMASGQPQQIGMDQGGQQPQPGAGCVGGVPSGGGFGGGGGGGGCGGCGGCGTWGQGGCRPTSYGQGGQMSGCSNQMQGGFGTPMQQGFQGCQQQVHQGGQQGSQTQPYSQHRGNFGDDGNVQRGDGGGRMMPNRVGPQGVSGQEVQRGGPCMDDHPQHFSGADRSGNWMGGCQGQPMMMAPEQGIGQGMGAMQPMGAGMQQGQQMPMQQGQAMAMQPAGIGGPQSMGPSQQG